MSNWLRLVPSAQRFLVHTGKPVLIAGARSNAVERFPRRTGVIPPVTGATSPSRSFTCPKSATLT